MTGAALPYRYVNGDGVWPGFEWEGLDLDADGTLRLTALPRLEDPMPAPASQLASVQPAAGIAVDRDGTILCSSPATAVVYRVDGCSGRFEPAPCVGGTGAAPTRFSHPSGLVIPTHRHALYVADSGNGRIQIFDVATLALIEILTGFERPVSLASDAEGHLYVVDTKAKRVDQVTASGDIVPSFWAAVQNTGRVHDPVAISSDGDAIYVLDGATHYVEVFDRTGQWLDGFDTSIEQASVLVAIDAVIYLGDPDRRRIAVFRRNQQHEWVREGDAAGYEGPVAALAADGRGGLLALCGGGLPPVRLALRGSYRHEGWLWSRAISIDGIEHFWNRLHALVQLQTDSHVQFFVHTGALPAPPPPPPFPGAPPAPWRAAVSEATDFFLTLDGLKTPALWIAVRFNNDLHATPALSQIRIDFDQESYLPYLPAIYREHEGDSVLLRYVSLFESFFSELETEIRDLPALVDPAATGEAALPWLAGFLASSLPETWSTDAQREAIATAYQRYARRGTVAGLLETLRREAGVRALVDEPLQTMAWWAMPSTSTSCKPDAKGEWVDGGGSILGLTTVLASAEPQGAVVGTTAAFDHSHLISQDEYGMPLFEAVAYRFAVQLYPGEVECAGKLDQIRAIVDREKPAHTVYTLCVIKPGLRIGYQARLGVDTLLGGGPVPGRLGETPLVLGGPLPSHLGTSSRLGVSTHL